MKLSIITINLNNEAGLEKTMKSVLSQTSKDLEYVVVDGASTDKSLDVIQRFADEFGSRLKWVSEPDSGIYNAMNKGLHMATGEYFQILNSGDILAAEDVTERMFLELEKQDAPSILYGNMVKSYPDGCLQLDKSFEGRRITMRDMYSGTLNHDSAYIRRDLFEKYGYYDESLKIVSDWKWYLQAIVFGGEQPKYADIDVTLFDMGGISETNRKLRYQERRRVLEALIPPGVLSDYDIWVISIDQMARIKRYPWAYRLVWFLETCLCKWERRQKRLSDKNSR